MSASADRSAIHASATAVRDALRELVANLLRVMRGGGRPEDVLPQARALTAVCATHREIAGDDPDAAQIAAALKLEMTLEGEVDGEGWSEDWDRAVNAMVQGALQVAAAELLAQRAQAAAGRRELFAGYRTIERLHSRQLSRLRRRGAY